MPEPLPRWQIAFLSFVMVCFLAGLGFTLAASYDRADTHMLTSIANTFYVFAAAFGMSQAAAALGSHIRLRRFVKENAALPVSLQIDGESGYAIVTRLDGGMTSLQVPDEVLNEGPEAVMAFVVDALED